MILKIIRPMVLLILCIGAFNGLTVGAQEDDAAAFVFEAFARPDEGYHFTFRIGTVQTFTDADQIDTITETSISGEGVVNADGNSQLRALIEGSDNQIPVPGIGSIEIERIDLDDETYIDLPDETETEGDVDLRDYTPGWYRMSYIDSLFGELRTVFFGLNAITDLPTLTGFDIDNATTETLVEIAPETIEGIEMRVFDLELDAFAIAARTALRTSGAALPLLSLFDESAILIQSDLSLTYRVWIGADDGLPYQLTGEYNAYVPYLSAGTDSPSYRPNFDLTTNVVTRYTFSQHGENTLITAPDAELLNN